MMKETVPVILLCDRIPGPVGSFKILKDNPHVLVLAGIIGPDVKIPVGRTLRGSAGSLEPGMLIGGMVNYQLIDHYQVPFVRFLQQLTELPYVPVGGVDPVIIRDVVSVVAKRRWKERKKPDRRNAQVLKVIQLGHQPLKITDAIAVSIAEGLDMQLIDYCILVPVQVIVQTVFRFNHG